MDELVTAPVLQALVVTVVLAAAALVVRLKLPSGEPPRSLRVEALAAALTALACTALALLWSAPLHFGGSWALAASDFSEHCQALYFAELAMDHPEYPPKRSRLAGAVVAAMGDGPLDAFLNTALAAHLALSAGLYVWGRALHSRMAGFCTALLSRSLGPVAELVRTMSFYPLFTAVFVLAAASVAVAARWPRVLVFLAAGVLVGSTMLFGLRGLVWFLPFAGAGVVLAVRRPWPRVPLRLGAFLAPIWLAWMLGRVVYHEDATSLERLVNPELRLSELGFEGYGPPYSDDSHFVWGRTPALQIPATLQTLASGPQPPPDRDALWAIAGPPFRAKLLGWMPLVGLATLTAIVGLRRHPRRLFALLATILPFAAGLPNGVLLLLSDTRFLGSSMPFFALVGGVALACLAQPARHQGEGTRPWWGMLVVALLILVTGLVPSFLSPVASWRPEPGMPAGNREVACYLQAGQGGDSTCLQRHRPHSPQCVTSIREELEAGGSRWPISLPDTTRPADRR